MMPAPSSLLSEVGWDNLDDTAWIIDITAMATTMFIIGFQVGFNFKYGKNEDGTVGTGDHNGPVPKAVGVGKSHFTLLKGIQGCLSFRLFVWPTQELGVDSPVRFLSRLDSKRG